MNEELHTLPPFIDFCVKILGYEPSVYDDYAKCFTYLECLTYTYTYLKNQVAPAVDAQNAVIQEMKDYMEHYFDNLDVQEEINNKLDDMAESGELTNIISAYADSIYEEYQSEINLELTNYKNSVNNEINNLEERINEVASGSPLKASSTSEMTDTTRIYVNTTDGKWYYYDGSEWQIGGVYQATEIADNSVTPQMTTFLEANHSSNYLDVSNLITGYWINDYTKTPQANASLSYYKPTDFEVGETYIASRVSTSSPGHIFVSCFNGNTNVYFQDVNLNTPDSKTFTIPETATDVYISMYNSTIGNVYINKGTTKLSYEPYYNNFKFDEDLIAVDNFYNKLDVIVVNPNGSGNYTTISDAVRDATNGDVIVVYPGNYTNETIEAWGKNIAIIGIDKNTTIISNETCDYTTPPIEFGAGLLKNLSFISKYNETNYNSANTKSYALHVEDNNLLNKKLLVENCNFESEVSFAAGIGMRGGCDVEFNNCRFIGSNSRVGGNGSLFIHDADNIAYVGIQNAHFKNCEFLTVYDNTTFTGLRIDSQDRSGSTVNIEFINNVNVNMKNGIVKHLFRNGQTTETYDSINELPNYNLTYSSYGNNDSSLNR